MGKLKETSTGEKIKFYRERAQKSQLDLSLESGVGLSSISKLEQNQRRASVETLIRIGAALNLDSRELAYLLRVNLYVQE